MVDKIVYIDELFEAEPIIIDENYYKLPQAIKPPLSRQDATLALQRMGIPKPPPVRRPCARGIPISDRYFHP